MAKKKKKARKSDQASAGQTIGDVDTGGGNFIARDQNIQASNGGIAIGGDFKDSSVVQIGGSVKAGGDVVFGDQVKLISKQLTENPSPETFLQALAAVQAQIAALKHKPELSLVLTTNLAAAEQKVVQAAEEAKKDKPQGEQVKQSLAEAKETMDLLKGSLGSAVGLGTLLGQLIAIAIKLFGA